VPQAWYAQFSDQSYAPGWAPGLPLAKSGPGASSLEGISGPIAAAATASASASAVIAASPLVAVDCGVGSTGILLLPCCQGDAVASCDSRTLVLQCCLLLAERVASMTPQL